MSRNRCRRRKDKPSEPHTNDEFDESKNDDDFEIPTMVQLPLPDMMERTSSSLGFIQNILKAETTSAYRIAWGIFLRELTEDLKCVEKKIGSLQENVRAKDELLTENANAFDELQIEMENEKRAALVQEREANRKVAEELGARIRTLEAELAETMEIKTDLLEKFNTIFRRHKSSKTKKQQLIQEVEDLSHEIEVQKEIIVRLKKALNDSKIDMEEECEKSYKEGYKDGRHVAAIEELGEYEVESEKTELASITAHIEKQSVYKYNYHNLLRKPLETKLRRNENGVMEQLRILKGMEETLEEEIQTNNEKIE